MKTGKGVKRKGGHRVRFTALQKKRICQKNEELGENSSRPTLITYAREELKIGSPSTGAITAILKEKEKWLAFEETNKKHAQARSQRPSLVPLLEKALSEWFFRVEKQEGIVLDNLLVTKAQKLAKEKPELRVPPTFKFSDGWLDEFKKRHGISASVLHGEAESADMAGIEAAQTVVPELLKGYSPENIYNGDETGLYWKLLPSKTLVSRHVKGRKGKKRSKARMCDGEVDSERNRYALLE